MVAVLKTRIKEPNETYWKKLLRKIKYLNGTNKKYCTLSSDDLKVVKWYLGSSFVVYSDFKSHDRAIMSMG